MSEGRTIWWAKDCAWWRRERIIELGEEFGADGPAVLDWLSCEAKTQNDGGWVKAGVKAVARGTFVDPVTVRNVLQRCVTLGALHDLDYDGGLFTCRISGWEQDNRRGATALRVARHRAKNGDPVTPGNDPKRPVTPVTHRAEQSRGSEPDGSDPRERPQPSRTVDQDRLPDEFPAELTDTARAVLAKLEQLQGQRGGGLPTLRGVGLAVAALPDRDHLAVAADLEHWALAGSGQRKTVKDWARTFRTFCQTSPPGSVSRRAPGQRTGLTSRGDVLRALEGDAA